MNHQAWLKVRHTFHQAWPKVHGLELCLLDGGWCWCPTYASTHGPHVTVDQRSCLWFVEHAKSGYDDVPYMYAQSAVVDEVLELPTLAVVLAFLQLTFL